MRRALVACFAALAACGVEDEGATRRPIINLCIPLDCNDSDPCTHDICEELLGCDNPPVADPLCCATVDDCETPNGCTSVSCVPVEGKEWNNCVSEGQGGEGCCADPGDCPAPQCHEAPCTDNECGAPVPTPSAPGCCFGPGNCPTGNLCQQPVCDDFVCGFTAKPVDGCCNVVEDCQPADACHAVDCVQNACVVLTLCDAGTPLPPAAAPQDAPPPPPPDAARPDAPLPPDAAPPDAPPPQPDAALPDAPLPPDAGLPDAPPSDAAPDDAAPDDAAPDDAAPDDAAPDDAAPDDAAPDDAAPDDAAPPDAFVELEQRLRGGGGCQVGAGGRAPVLPALALLALALLRARRRRIVVGCALLLAATPARAQDLDAQLYRPPATSGGVGALDGVSVPPHLAVAAGVFFAYTREPLVLETGGDESAVVGRQLDAQVAVSVGLGSRVEVGLIAPVLLDQTVDAVRGLGACGLGDLRLEAKVRAFARGGVALALAAGLGLPTGGDDGYYADGGVTFRPRAVLGVAVSDVELLAQLGAVLGRRREAADLDVGPQLAYGAGARWRVGGGFSLFATLAGLMTPGGGAGTSPVEVLAGPELRVPGLPLDLSLAAGRGLNDGYGAPSLRVTFAARWSPRPAAPPPARAMPRVEIATATPPPAPEPPPALERAVERLPVEPAPRDPAPIARPEDRELAEVTDTAIQIKQQIFFASGTARIRPRSFRLLAAVARILHDHPEITLLRIEGHTDDRGRRARNLELSQRRADAVRDHLIEVHGIDPRRLVAQGFGPDRPVASNRTTAGRARNRRSELVIVERQPR